MFLFNINTTQGVLRVRGRHKTYLGVDLDSFKAGLSYLISLSKKKISLFYKIQSRLMPTWLSRLSQKSGVENYLKGFKMNNLKVSFSVSLFQLNCEEDTFQFLLRNNI